MSVVTALLMMLATAQAPTAGAPAASPAVASAEQWMRLLDQGRYPEVWDQAGTLVKTHIGQAGWAGALDPVRKPLGAVASRRLKSETSTRSLPGAPDGDYEVLEFDTDFAGNHSAVETIIMAHEASGWKVDGYFIK
jgi:hypothetical protein